MSTNKSLGKYTVNTSVGKVEVSFSPTGRYAFEYPVGDRGQWIRSSLGGEEGATFNYALSVFRLPNFINVDYRLVPYAED